MIFKGLVLLMRKRLNIDLMRNNIQISLKRRYINNKRLIKIVDDKNVDCLMNFSHQLKECILIYVTSTIKS